MAQRLVLPVAVGVALFAGACSPTTVNHGYRFNQEAFDQIEPGVSTRQDVASLMGSPTTFNSFSDTSWYYIEQKSERRSFYQSNLVDQRVVAIDFDPSGVVADIRLRGLDDARQVAVVERTTPTGGNELTVVQQFVGNIGRFNRDPADAGGPIGGPPSDAATGL
ncbi:outer membrane protein assembly factor BamE [Marinivivus vitaminiproducens]|uniref:outer membrane protein assembly factor BamE n=1 Tax=Marinivivus vitaminiproducens TaxID=3035935 RepID=UPI0027A6F1D6|nr:outer membrane protein assembly factor BamE [Geminicoccaceae bacterium SCSIO 64248]